MQQQADFTVKQWSFTATEAEIVANTYQAKRRFGNAISVNVRLSAVPSMVTNLLRAGYTVEVQ